MRNRWLIGVGAVILIVGWAAPAFAQEVDPYLTDPIDLIAYRDETRVHSSGTDLWEVWTCDVPDGSVAISANVAVSIFESAVRPYFEGISGGVYSPRFRVGGAVVASQVSGWPGQPFSLQGECEALVAGASPGGAEGAIVVVDADYSGGYATPGIACFGGSCSQTFPGNARIVVVGAGAVATITGIPPALLTVAHEIGHALHWPHSFGGLVDFGGGVVYEYDNPMDVMSAGEHEALDIGTVAANRYAAGWLGTQNLIFHRGGTQSYLVTSNGSLQMIVLPTEVRGVFESIGVRLRTGYDIGLPVEGVEVYRIDQSAAVCSFRFGGQCIGVDRRTSPVPAVADPAGTSHVYGVGANFTVRGVSVTVDSQVSGGFLLTVSGDAVSERFLDDNGNPHEANIEFIADRGITRGCNPPTVDHFCPAQSVTRAEMAAFLTVARGITPAADLRGIFTDVPAAAWYAPYVEALADAGITTGLGGGLYGPDQLVSRAEMAVFLARAFGLAVAGSGLVFTDVGAGEWYAPSVEAIRLAGITTGCAANLYCPLAAVRRDEMATFLARGLQ